MSSMLDKMKCLATLSYVVKEAKRYIDEGNDFFEVSCGGFSISFDATKEVQNG